MKDDLLYGKKPSLAVRKTVFRKQSSLLLHYDLRTDVFFYTRYMDTESVITADGLTKKFGSFTAVDNISFSVRRGEIFGFLGANGAGKTTAMRMLCGLSRPTAGRAAVAGYDVGTQPEQVKRHIGYMSQRFSLYDDLTVAENMRLFGGIYGMGGKTIRRKTDTCLRSLALEDERDTLVGSLPLGWKQKLAFTVATFHEPGIVFLDEPTGGVDPVTRAPHVLGADLPRRRQWHDRFRNHALHGRGRVLRPRVNHGRRSHSRARHSQGFESRHGHRQSV